MMGLLRLAHRGTKKGRTREEINMVWDRLVISLLWAEGVSSSIYEA
jgi:hypothetical protein